MILLLPSIEFLIPILPIDAILTNYNFPFLNETFRLKNYNLTKSIKINLYLELKTNDTLLQ